MQDELLERASRAIAESRRLGAELEQVRQEAAQHDRGLERLLELLRIEISKPRLFRHSPIPRRNGTTTFPWWIED